MKAQVFQVRLAQPYLQTDQAQLNHFMEKVQVKKTATHFLNDQVSEWSVLVFYEDKNGMPPPAKSQKIAYAADEPLTPDEAEKLKTLKQWRYDKSIALNMPSYMIVSNAELIALVKTPIRDIADLSKLKGFGEFKISKFGEELLMLLGSI